jgi:hydroxymethylbilane synthase
MLSTIIIGTRGSDLALWQAHFIQNTLLKLGLLSEIKVIKTQGDQIQNIGFDKMEGKGFFTKELEEALLAGTIDLAVHSFKDLPTTAPKGLIIAALSVHNKLVAETVGIERKILNLFDGGCQLPLGVYCVKKGKEFNVWVSKATTWNQIPARLFFCSIYPENLAQSVVDKINKIKPESIFITRTLKNDSILLRSLEAHNYNVHGLSLVDFTSIPFVEIPLTDWIFFSSSQAVIHFFEQQPELNSNVKYAVIGKGTELTLKQYGYRADFIGEQSDIFGTGRSFSDMVSGQSILFPKAADSLRSIQKHLGENTKVHDLNVYKTVSKHNLKIPKASVLVFTSPSNVASYFTEHKITNQKVVAIGMSTAQKLISFGVNTFTTANTPDETGLTEAIFNL